MAAIKIIEVWQPKYSSQELLISTNKVSPGDNYIKITKDKTYDGKLLKIQGEEVIKYKTQKNGAGEVYCVPLSKFEIV